MLKLFSKNSFSLISNSTLRTIVTTTICKNTSTTNQNEVSFEKLFRNSSFVKLGDPKNKILIGKIVDVVNEDLYIDFGGKFECICKKPYTNAHHYVRNEYVKIRLNDFEMASHFLGAVKHITLLEADATILGIHRDDFKNLNM